MGRHRQEDGDVTRTEPTQILPVVKRRLTASPLLLVAGGVALTLILGVGGWALMSSPSSRDPLVYPWSGERPGDIDVSVSMVPTAEPAQSPSPSVSPSRSRAPRQSSPTPQTLAGGTATRSPATASLMTALVASISGWQGNIMINVDVHNPGRAAAAWTVDLTFDRAVHVNPPWNAMVMVIDDRHLRFTSERELGPGDTIRFGFIAGYSGRNRPDLVSCTVDGRNFSCTPV